MTKFHKYSDAKHFQRQEKHNVGMEIIAKTKWFRLGYKDYFEGNEFREFGNYYEKAIMVQSAYELGRLFGAYCKGRKVVVKKWYYSTGKRGWIVDKSLVRAVIKAREDGAFC